MQQKPGLIITIKNLLPIFQYNHALLLLLVIAIILLSLLLAGCSSGSPLIPGIFLLSMYYQPHSPNYDPAQVDPGLTTSISSIVGRAQLEIRVGFFGICVTPDGGGFLCSNNATALAQQVHIDQDPLNLIWVASTFRDNTVFPYLLIVAVILAFFAGVALITYPGWIPHADQVTGSEMDLKPFPSRILIQIILILTFVSTIFILVSVLWQHTASVAAASMVQDMGNGSVKSGVGTSAMVLGWISFVLMLLVSIGSAMLLIFAAALDIYRATGYDEHPMSEHSHHSHHSHMHPMGKI